MSEKKFEHYPLTRSEYIAAMVHLYRGELYRAQVWRQRLDITTNWAVLSVGAILSFVFTDTDKPQLVLVLGMYMIFTMLVYEARRFRFYDVWRSRVRRIEENFYVPILRRDLTSPMENWGFYVAEDLLNPSYKISFLKAVKARLSNNYAAIFGVMLLSWFVKLQIHAPDVETDMSLSIWERSRLSLELNGLPWWISCGGVACLYVFLFGVYFFVKPGRRPEDSYFGKSRVDSIDDVG